MPRAGANITPSLSAAKTNGFTPVIGHLNELKRLLDELANKLGSEKSGALSPVKNSGSLTPEENSVPITLPSPPSGSVEILKGLNNSYSFFGLTKNSSLSNLESARRTKIKEYHGNKHMQNSPENQEKYKGLYANITPKYEHLKAILEAIEAGANQVNKSIATAVAVTPTPSSIAVKGVTTAASSVNTAAQNALKAAQGSISTTAVNAVTTAATTAATNATVAAVTGINTAAATSLNPPAVGATTKKPSLNNSIFQPEHSNKTKANLEKFLANNGLTNTPNGLQLNGSVQRTLTNKNISNAKERKAKKNATATKTKTQGSSGFVAQQKAKLNGTQKGGRRTRKNRRTRRNHSHRH